MEQDKELNKYNENISINDSDLFAFCENNKSKNRFVYADTCGPIGRTSYHEDIIKTCNSDDIIVGTFSVHTGDPKSHLGREIISHKTSVYEYGIHTIMKTYISIKKSVFKQFKSEYIKNNPNKDPEDIEKEDIIEYKFPGYIKIEKINKQMKDVNPLTKKNFNTSLVNSTIHTKKAKKI